MAKTQPIEPQLAALAAATDRANRPTSLLTLPALLLVASFLYAAWSYRALAQERSFARNRQAQASQITRLVADIEAASKQEVDLSKTYPPAPFFGSQIEESWTDKATGSSRHGLHEPAAVSQVTSARVDPTSPLTRSDVTVTVNNEPLDSIFRAIDATLNHEFLNSHAFVSMAQLTPAGTGWRAVIRFSIYEKK